ncbi:MAG: DUF3843 family protein [Muribaculaceae bacterium]|nr:DUF3843 family protein [Muribaculaceae bacterium]
MKEKAGHISMERFLVRQPSWPEETSTDKFYLDVANKLLEIARHEHLFASWPESVVEQGALCLTGYYQDVIADAGVWHGFIDENRRLLGKRLPFYEVTQEYMDYELNREDVRFMVWYVFAMTYESRRELYPLDKELLHGADRWYEYLDSIYEEAPIPSGYNPAHELEFHNPEDQEQMMTLANWLYMHCYLLTPANALTLSGLLADPSLFKDDESGDKLREVLHKAMNEYPTGPLALYLRDWLWLTVEHRMPPMPKTRRDPESGAAEHPYYTKFTAATSGKPIAYFGSYEDLNRFFIEALGWAQGEEHLPALKQASDFVLMVNPAKGMLVARDIARCIADPSNPLYDREYARLHAIDLMTVRGCCPGDLLKYVCGNGWLPDARFPGTDDTALPQENWEFIGRCYLQQYFVGD